MATIQFKKGDEYIAKLSKLEVLEKTEVCGSAIYAAADIVADAMRRELEKVPTDEHFATTDDPVRGPKKIQKESLLQSLGIAKMQDDGRGFLNVKIGFDGYNRVKTKRWPKGQPNQMVARSIESGTSWMQKNPFVRRAVASTRKEAIETMRKKVDESIDKIMERKE